MCYVFKCRALDTVSHFVQCVPVSSYETFCHYFNRHPSTAQTFIVCKRTMIYTFIPSFSRSEAGFMKFLVDKMGKSRENASRWTVKTPQIILDITLLEAIISCYYNLRGTGGHVGCGRRL